MKKSISILLSLLMILSLAACVPLKTAGTDKTPVEAPVAAPVETAAQSNAIPAATEAPAATPAPALPTEEPAPAPADAPSGEVIVNATDKLEQVQSLHVDMKMNSDIELLISLGGIEQHTPMDINVLVRGDITKTPGVAQLDLIRSTPGQETASLLYVVQDGESIILYLSRDNGVTWEKQTDPKDSQLLQSPLATTKMLADVITDVEKTDTAEVNGVTATVYSGKVSGKYLGTLLTNIGVMAEIQKILGSEISEETLATLSDLEVTVTIDEESGLPLRYTIDMTASMKNLIESLLGVTGTEDIGATLNLSTAVLDIALSQFDSIDSIEIPEAALNAPAA